MCNLLYTLEAEWEALSPAMMPEKRSQIVPCAQ